MDKMKKVKKKRKMAKNLTLPHGDLNPRYLNKTFPPKIWILREIRSIELKVLKKSRLYNPVHISMKVIPWAAVKNPIRVVFFSRMIWNWTKWQDKRPVGYFAYYHVLSFQNGDVNKFPYRYLSCFNHQTQWGQNNVKLHSNFPGKFLKIRV